VSQKQKIENKVSLVETCSICGKPISPKAKSNVTRFLFGESRCNCIVPGRADPAAQLPAAISNSEAPHEVPADDAEAKDVAEQLGDRYQVLSVLGKGGMGAVYKVKDTALDKTFAIKVLRHELVEDQASVKRFQLEARAASELTHANLAAVYSYGMGTKGSPYIVMDYLEGENLADLIKQEGFLDSPRAVDIFIQACEALAHAHRKGVIHRDVKPGNIIITKDENGNDYVKIVDFGIAKVLADPQRATQHLTQTGEVMGSPLYMSPEQGLGVALDKRSDIYSFGCVMYEAVTGKPPFLGDNPIQTIMKHINADAPPLAVTAPGVNIPKDLQTVILHCLEKKPERRYQTMDDLQSDLQAVREGKKIKARLGPTKKEVRNREKRLAIFVCIGVALCILAFTISGFNSHSSSGGFSPSQDALKYDQEAYVYFNKGQYQECIDLLQFCVHTYARSGDNPMYKADCTQHIGKSYLAMKEYGKAARSYQEALDIYRKLGSYKDSMMGECVRDYSTVLRNLHRDREATEIEKEFQDGLRAGK
jgi:serine/threonine protein kinase